MAEKHADTKRVGGPGASHENRKHPEKSREHAGHPSDSKRDRHSSVSGGGGEKDSHHSHSAGGKAGH